MFKGSIVAIVTPFHEDLSVNYEKLTELLNWHVESGTDGIVILGTTGEAPTLSKATKLKVFEHTVNIINKRIPVIAGTGSNNTIETIAFSKEVEALGVDGLLIVTPYYNLSNETGYINHFTMIADSLHTPIILYNVPGRTGSSLPVSVIKELSKHKNIVGLKEASGNLSYFTKIATVVSPDFLLFSGNDDIVLPTLSVGAAGVISVAANVIPAQFSKMVADFHQGKIKESMDTQLHYLELINSLFVEVNPIPVKEYLNQMGKDVGTYRFPLSNPSQNTSHLISCMIEKYQL